MNSPCNPMLTNHTRCSRGPPWPGYEMGRRTGRSRPECRSMNSPCNPMLTNHTRCSRGPPWPGYEMDRRTGRSRPECRSSRHRCNRTRTVRTVSERDPSAVSWHRRCVGRTRTACHSTCPSCNCLLADRRTRAGLNSSSECILHRSQCIPSTWPARCSSRRLLDSPAGTPLPRALRTPRSRHTDRSAEGQRCVPAWVGVGIKPVSAEVHTNERDCDCGGREKGGGVEEGGGGGVGN